MYPVRKYLILAFLLYFNSLAGQNYHAINGSSFAGSLGSSANPASIIDAPFAWDITPLAVQEKHTTNALAINNYSLLSPLKNAEVSTQFGIKKRFLLANQDIRLLNTRIKLNEKSAIAFGANIRNYMYAVNEESNWQDTISSLADFMRINNHHLPLSAQFVGSSWAEIYGSYARTLIDDGNRLLSAGLTLKLNSALAGGYARAQGINYLPLSAANANHYLLTNGTLQYGYSSNFDTIDNNNTATTNRKAFLQNRYHGVSADIGFEYILLSATDKKDGGGNTYDTKIGISIMDLGSNKYRYGHDSRLAIAGAGEGVTDSVIETKFSNVSTLDNFNDSLAGIANSISTIRGHFAIYEPTRLVINVDKHVMQNFFINAEATVPVISLASKNVLFIRDMNLFALTPRLETKSFGAYLPILYNARNQLWMGAAFKAGPVLFGIDNLGNLFSKNKAQSGGLYIAFTIRPGKKHEQENRHPTDKGSPKQRRSLDCPKL
jgi:hypothetical protein